MVQVMGVRTERDGIEPQLILGTDMDIIGILGTAPDANLAVVTKNVPIEVRTNDTALRTALGTTGTIPDALTAISAQLLTSTAARCIVVIVDDNEDADEVISNIVGSESLKTGMWALLDAPEDLGVTPRLILAPGYTSQTNIQLGALTLLTQGDNMTVAPTVGFTGGGSDPDKVMPTAHAVLGTGGASEKVASLVIDTPGSHLSGTLTVTFTGGGSEGDKVLPTASATLEVVANPICAAIPTVISRLRGKFLPEGPNSSKADFLTWMETLSQDMNIIHPQYQVAKIMDPDDADEIITKPLSPYIAGLYVRRDNEFDGIPGHSVANQSINGLIGVSPKVPLDITNDATVGMELIEKHAGIVVRGESGVDGSLADGGFTFWGTDTMAADTQWMFANVVRMRDYIEIALIRAVKFYIGRFNVTEQAVQAIINTMESFLSSLRADRHILDFRIGFDQNQNLPEELRLGFITINFRAEEPAPLRKVTIKSRRMREAQVDLAASISATLENLQSA